MGQLEDMQAFVRVVEAGAIGNAAEQIGIAKSAENSSTTSLAPRDSKEALKNDFYDNFKMSNSEGIRASLT